VTQTNASAPVAPPLIALGGWLDAEWFCPTLLSDDAVAGFTFPKLPGLRKQSFHVIDRATISKTPSRKTKPDSAALPKRLAGKVWILLERFGSTRMVACSQVKLLFETGPILFFGEFPASKVKQRSANKMRRELIEIGVRGCVIQAGNDSVIFMFWPSTETAITDFVNTAAPDYALHGDFEKALASSAPRNAKPVPSSATRSDKRASDREAKLLQEIIFLRQQVEALKTGQSPLAAMEQLGLDDARLKSMLKLLHPDKHANSAAATEAAQWLNNLRDLLKGKAPSA
jgi:hypothetical protein